MEQGDLVLLTSSANLNGNVLMDWALRFLGDSDEKRRHSSGFCLARRIHEKPNENSVTSHLQNRRAIDYGHQEIATEYWKLMSLLL